MLRSVCAGTAAVFLLLALNASAAVEPATLGSSSASRLGNLPLYFESNRGQTDERVQFFARGRNHTVYLRADGATIALKDELTDAGSRSAALERHNSTNSPTVRFVQMTLAGANPAPVSFGQEELSGRVNYLLGSNPSAWRQGVPTFGRVQYTGVYPGVALVYYGNEQELEYDFVIAPEADPSAIVLRFEGADRLEINRQGDLILHVGQNQLRQHKPVAYQTIAGTRRNVPARYQLKDSKTVVFALGNYDRAHPLTIDPILSYSTYLGGSKGDIGWAIAVDTDGRAYVAGDTLSVFTKLPTSGQQPLSGGGTKYGGDAFVARLDFDTVTTNLSLGYLTYLGGNGLDGAIGIAVDGAGAAYVTGYTTSSNFPSLLAPAATGLVQTNIGGTNVFGFNSHYSDAFVTKLDTNGLGVYSTYLGGELAETGVGITVDTNGSAYVIGYTDSALTYRITNQVATFRCTNSVCGGPKLVTNITTARLLIASQSVTNLVRSNVTATVTNVIETVVTTTLLSPMSTAPYLLGFPVVNAIQTNNNGTANLFVSKLAPDASALVYSTYLGGSGSDFGTGVAVDAGGNALITGYSGSSDFPATNAFQPFPGGGQDAVVAKLDPTGGALLYSTYLGGARNDFGYGIAVDASGAAYVTGAEGSTDFPSTPGSLNGGGVFLNSGSGTNAWTASSGGLSHTIVTAFAADPNNAGTFYAGTPRGVFKTTDSGSTWTGFSTGLVTRAINALLVSPFAIDTVYAGTPAGVFVSQDGGLNWTNFNDGLGSFDVRTLLIHPVTTNLFAGTSRGAYERALGATNWMLLGTGLQSRLVTALALNPLAPSNFFAATTAGIFKSTNGGLNWKSSNSGLKTTSVRSLAWDPTDPSVLYAGTTKGLYKSTNAAANWSIRTNGMGRPAINALLIEPGAANPIYAGTTNGLFKSLDSGGTWSLIQSNLTTRDVTTLAFVPGSSATVYAGTRGTNFAGGTNDVFLVKIAPDGQSLGYSFTIGGNRNDEGWDVAVDSAGSAFITGQTASRNFPVAGWTTNSSVQQTNLAGRIDAFLARVDATGATNLLSIYHGGTKNDFGHGIALDAAGNAYVVGRTESSRLPTTNGLDTISGSPLKFSGGRDAFVTKFLTSLPLLAVQPVAVASSGALPVVEYKLMVSWPAPAHEFTLEARDPSGGEWFPVAERPVVVNGRHQVILPAGSQTLLFRLRL